MNDEQIVKYCRGIIISNLKSQPQDFTKDIAGVLGSDKVLLDHCYGIRDLMQRCIDILENRGIWLDDLTEGLGDEPRYD